MSSRFRFTGNKTLITEDHEILDEELDSYFLFKE